MTSREAPLSGAAHDGRAGAGHEMDADHRSTSRVGPLLAGVVMLGFGLLMLHETLQIRGEGFAPDGPRFLPLVVVVLWIALSAVYLLQQLVRIAQRTDGLPAERFDHMVAAGILIALLVAYAYALEPLGYVLATSVFFVAAARTMGSRQLVRDVAIAIVLSLAVYLLFTRALGVHLPAGALPL